MPNAKLSNYLHLHFLVFVAGFTAILGELISIGSIDLVWYRMVFASIIMLLFIVIKKRQLRITKRLFVKYSLAGIIIALHWITFFESIKQSTISIALAMFSTGAFFASFLEPLFFKRRIRTYEILFGLIVILGVYLITQSELDYLTGIILGIVSALFSTLFSIFNSQFIETGKASTIAFYEFVSGVFFISLFLWFSGDGFSIEFFDISMSDLVYLLILASICTAYAFIAVIDVMKHITPFTVVLTYNLEPIYGIVLALLLFPVKEAMSLQFYIGALLIFITVIINGLISRRKSNVNNIVSNENEIKA